VRARSAQEIWETALGELQLQVSKSNYRTWLEKTVGLTYQGKQFVVGVPNTFAAEYLDKNQRSLIEKTLIGLTQQDVKVKFYVDGRGQDSLSGYGFQEEIPTTAPTSPPKLNPKYTFDSFVVSSCNRLAYAAALGVAENPGRSYNPLFIYGGAGLGKTHLLHAIGHMAQASNLKVLYLSAEEFTNEFIIAIREKQTKEFRHKYRSVDMLLIDDIQFICGKEQTEESFFHTFNELHNADRQMAITCDRPPKSIHLVEDRLRSRFEWGLTAGIKPPDFETRLAILQAKAKREGVDITPDVLEFIAHRIRHNIRELEGSLNRVVAYARLLRAMITPELATEALEDIASKQPKTASLHPAAVLEAVANSFQLTVLDLISRKRDKLTTLARQVAMYLIRQEANCSLAQIGKELGNREPITISQACKKIAADIDANSDLQQQILTIQQKLALMQKANT